MKIVGIQNEKGGVGKTATAVNLSFFLVKEGHRVCLIDFDPQGSSSLSYGIKVKKNDKTVVDTLATSDEKPVLFKDAIIKKFGVDILPSNNKLSNLQSMLSDQFGAHDLLHDMITKNKLSETYDYIIIDGPPQHGLLNQNIMRACTGIILSVQTKFLSVHASNKVLSTLEKMNEKIPGCNCKLIGLLPTFFQSNIKESINSLNVIKKHFEDKDSKIKQKYPDSTIIFSPIKNNTDLSVCTSKGLPVGMYNPSCSGSKCYELMAKEVIGYYNG